MSTAAPTDPELEAVCAELRRLDPNGGKTGQVLRETLDQLYDGQRTGRYRWDQLYKTEKTHCGTLVEINLQRRFLFADGKHLDFLIAGVEVDCKYSQRLSGWMIPPEAHGHLCLLVWADDGSATWSFGVVRATAGVLNTGTNRDGKATLSSVGMSSVRWMFERAPLPPNILLQLSEQKVNGIMSLDSGQERVNELFRAALGMRVSRSVVATVARQEDYMKRVRYNGGARSALRGEGIIILGQYQSHVEIARSLQVPEPGPGDSVAVRVVRTRGGVPGVAQIDGAFWRVARPEDPEAPAPLLPPT